MKGHIRERGRGWEIFYDLGPDPLTGQRRLRTRTVRGSRAEAEKTLSIILGRVASDTQADPQRTTVADYTERWLTLVSPSLRPTTVDSYRQKLKLACSLIGQRRLRDLTGEQLTDLYRQLGRSPQTIIHVHRVLHRAFADAVRWGVLGKNPAASALPPRVERAAPRTWTAGQMSRFLEHVQTDRLGPLFRLACMTGMRRGEVCGLRWPQLDLERGTLMVEGTLVMVEGRPVEGTPKTRAGRRRIALDRETVRVLEEHQVRQAEDRAYFGWSGDRVFCWEDGRDFSPDWVSKQFRRLISLAGVPRIRLHDLRHTYATLALQAGVPAKVVADRLGHAGIQITLDTYTHHSEELDRVAAEQLAGLVC